MTQTGLAPTDDRESAMFLVLQPGAYTAVVQGKQNIRSKIIPTIVPAVHSRLEVVSRKLSQLAVTSSGRPQPCERRVDDTRKCEASHGAVGGLDIGLVRAQVDGVERGFQRRVSAGRSAR